MSQAFTRILDNQSNKLLANLPSNDAISGFKMDAFAPIVQPMPLQVQSMPLQVQSMPLQSPQVQVGEGTQEFKGIKLLGFEFTVYTLILVVVLTVCVAYFLYKYFFTKTDLVVYKKNPKKESKKNKEKNKEEFSNGSDASNTSNVSGSLSVQTLDE
jgi:hypothetical protein